ncbi:hypothetical protein KQX54_015414 [Cotesia glomerata]|uniref:Cilia- and flagella-associated protein 69 ARM repeats domain-containing protein n=1 Tax=Cotesia glomerata TaxID=32391 RepID=A0AAV7IC42_COTGL|nr:hypothetical protein KQX54_015414 [Cotesia glomerata]
MNIKKIDILNHDFSRKLDHKKSDKPCDTSVPSKLSTHEYINKKSINYKIERLRKLISDPITRENEIWIDRLLNSCLREIGHQGYKLKYLSFVIDVLQFLSWKSNERSEYKRHLNDMINLCAYSPLLEGFSENSLHSETLENYFTVLGYLTILLPCQEQVINILKSLSKLLNRSSLSNNFTLKFEICCQSIEKSELPFIIVKLIEISPPKMYTKVLDTTYVLASVSKICCHKMLKAGILNHLRSRMDEQSLIDIVVQLEQDSFNINKNIVVINILLLLMNSIFPPQSLNIIKEIISSCSVSTRLLIGVGTCLWSCIIKFSVTIEKFVEMEGLYSILNLIDQTNHLVQNVYLGLLTDLCLNPHCIPHICTWRSTDKTNTLISLLIRVWKDEEGRIGVKRTENGCIAEDSITFCVVDQFFRFVQGQVWAEVIRYIRESGIIPAGNDGEMLLVMRQRHRKFALYVRDRQKKILRDAKRLEMIKEKNELEKTRNVALISILIGFKKLMN